MKTSQLASRLATCSSRIMKDSTGSVQNSSDMAPPFRSLIFLGIWKFLRGSSSLGLWPGKGELLKLRASDCALLRRSGASCSGITLSPHPAWSPFWLAVAEVAAEFFWGSPPSGWSSPVSIHSESFFPTALGFRAIFGHRARITGNVALTITAPLHTHTLSSSPSLRHCENDVYVLLHHCKTLPSLCLHTRESAQPSGGYRYCKNWCSDGMWVE